MPEINVVNLQEQIVLRKQEVQRIIEATFILRALGKMTDDEKDQTKIQHTVRAMMDLAWKHGRKHLDQDGNLLQTERQRAADASVPD